MLSDLQNLQVKKDRIKRLKHEQNSIAERLRIEMKKHSKEHQMALVEEQEVQKALEEIERSKKVAIERFKMEELRRMEEEREKMRKDREAKEREM